MLLALDTSTSAVGAAVCAGQQVLARSAPLDGRGHAELLAPAVEQVLAEAGVGVGDLDAVAVGVGPGPFTGLRVGLVTALVLGLARDLPVHGLCSLDAIAAAAVDGGLRTDFLVATDARRKEVYWAAYSVRDAGAGSQGAPVAVRKAPPEVARAADLSPAVRALPCVGRGALLYPDVLSAVGDGPLDVDPGWLGRTVQRGLDGDPAVELVAPEPWYLRRPDAVASVSVPR